jgi:hypothetical protein
MNKFSAFSASILAVGAMAPSLHADLIAGWDFSQLNSIYGTVGDLAFTNWSEVDTLWANYSDLYRSHDNPAYWGITGPSGPHYGMMYLNGDFGSDVVVDLSIPETTVLNSQIAIGDSLSLNNEATTFEGGFNGVFGDSAFPAVGQLARTISSFACTESWAGKSFVISADVTGLYTVEDWSLSYAGRVAQPEDGSTGADLVWEYSRTGADGSYVLLDTDHISGSEARFLIDLSAIADLDGSSTLYLRGTFENVSSALASSRSSTTWRSVARRRRA